MRHMVITAVLGLCLTSAACSTAAAPEPAAVDPLAVVVPSGFKAAGGPGNGFLVAVPTDWVVLDLTKDDVDQGLRRAGLSGTTLEQTRQGLKALIPGKGVWAADPGSAARSPGALPTNLNGFCQAGGGKRASLLIEEAKRDLGRLKAEIVESGEVTIGAGRAVRITYTFGSAETGVKGTQYHVPHKGRTCVVTLSTDQDGRQELFDRIGRTVRPL
ncbi:hypothetical protein [Streptosporangium sp. KLBMP 9127]|nr:hypothetical protein [Streptosporangium sp. KLBMP 9127]